MKLINPRDMSKMQDDQCFYLPVIGADGGMLNDPVTMKISPDHYWVSLADSDFMLYLLGVAMNRLMLRLARQISPLWPFRGQNLMT